MNVVIDQTITCKYVDASKSVSELAGQSDINLRFSQFHGYSIITS